MTFCPFEKIDTGFDRRGSPALMPPTPYTVRRGLPAVQGQSGHRERDHAVQDSGHMQPPKHHHSCTVIVYNDQRELAIPRTRLDARRAAGKTAGTQHTPGMATTEALHPEHRDGD